MLYLEKHVDRCSRKQWYADSVIRLRCKECRVDTTRTVDCSEGYVKSLEIYGLSKSGPHCNWL